jgi:hypothetical protein
MVIMVMVHVGPTMINYHPHFAKSQIPIAIAIAIAIVTTHHLQTSNLRQRSEI